MDHQELFSGLEKAAVGYVVTGGLALNLHGVARLNYDVDLALQPVEGNIRKAVTFLEGSGYLRRDGSGEGGQRVLRFQNPEAEVVEVDLAIAPVPDFGELRSRAVDIVLHGVTVPVMSLADLAALKRLMGRPEDMEDLRNIEVLMAMQAGSGGASPDDRRREQIRKFREWPVEKRCGWLITNSQLQQSRETRGRSGKGALRGRAAMKRGKIKGLTHEDKS